MFLVTCVTTLRERSSGTLERLLAMPAGKLDLLLGYALAFGLLGAVQSALAATLCVGLLGLEVDGAGRGARRGRGRRRAARHRFGLFVSAFARTEFQAVQFMPAVVFPQLLLCGLFVPRDQMPAGLELVSDLLPLSYAVDAMSRRRRAAARGTSGPEPRRRRSGSPLVLLGLGAATLRRRTA